MDELTKRGLKYDPDVRGGQVCIAGTRIHPEALGGFAKAGYAVDQIMREYPSLTIRQVADALAWASIRKSKREKMTGIDDA